MAFERFIELVMPPYGRLFDKIIIVAGNHDHQLSQSARETQYVNYITSRSFPPGWQLPDVWNATNIFVESNPLPSYFLQNLIRRSKHMKNVVVSIAYPTFGLRNPTLDRAVIFSHGHYIEPIYLLLSHLKALILSNRILPEEIWDIEAENGPWIDFFWSALGEARGIGEGIEIVHNRLNAPDELTRLVVNFAKGAFEKGNGIPDPRLIENVLFRAISPLVRLVGDSERSKSGPVLSTAAERGLRWFMSGPLLAQIKSELANPELYSEVAFLFGHTHKPFVKDMTFNGFSGWVHVHNTGGWVVDSVETKQSHGGAITLIDERLNAVSVRMYNETHENQKWQIIPQEAARGSDWDGRLCKALDEILKTRGPWQTFPDVVAEAISVRREHLRNSIPLPDTHHQARWEQVGDESIGEKTVHHYSIGTWIGSLDQSKREEITVEGDKYENISQSVLATRGSIAKGVIGVRSRRGDEMAEAFKMLESAINGEASPQLSEERRREALELLAAIANQGAKPDVSKSVLRSLGKSLWSVIESVEPLSKACSAAWQVVEKIWL